MNDSQLFKKELVLLEVEQTTQSELFNALNSMLLEKKYVTEGFLKAIQKREIEYPTGIQTATIGVAIPHTDPENILEPFVAVIRPRKSIVFEPMGMADGHVEAQLIFVLGVKRDGGQVIMLQHLMNMLMDDDTVSQLLGVSDPAEMVSIIADYFAKDEQLI